MTSAEQQISVLGISLPKTPDPVGNFLPAVEYGNLLFLSGQGPLLEDGSLAKGKVGLNVTTEQAYEHARRTALVLLSAMREATGNLDRIERIVKVFGMVNAVPEFTEHPQVINGCSDLLALIFQERGRHARSAIGVGSLPSQITVEIEMIVALGES